MEQFCALSLVIGVGPRDGRKRESGDRSDSFKSNVLINSKEFTTILLLFSTGGFASQGTFGDVWRYFWLPQLEGYYWHQMGRGQGCC